MAMMKKRKEMETMMTRNRKHRRSFEVICHDIINDHHYYYHYYYHYKSVLSLLNFMVLTN